MESTSAHSWCRECDFNTEQHGNCCEVAERVRRAFQSEADRCKRRRMATAKAPERTRTSALRAEIRRLRALRKTGTSVAKEMQKVHPRRRPTPQSLAHVLMSLCMLMPPPLSSACVRVLLADGHQ